MKAPRVEIVPRVDRDGEKAGEDEFKVPGRGRKALAVLFSNIREEPMRKISKEDLEPMPKTAQRYLRYAGVVGRALTPAIRITQEGEFYMGPKRGWLPFKAVEYYNAQSPGFVWSAKLRFSPSMPVDAVDAFVGGTGRMKGTLLGVIPVVNQCGPDLDKASLMRFLNEMTWFPEEFLRDYISWEEVDDESVIVKIEQYGKRDQAVIKVDKEGRMVDFIAQRHSLEGKELIPRTWRTPISSYKEFDGLRLPYEGEALYEKGAGPESYIRARLTNVDFNALRRMEQ
jgi:hypothetical protein